MKWTDHLLYDPVNPLLNCDDEVVRQFARCDLLGDVTANTPSLRNSVEVVRILKKQLPNGAWPRKGPAKHPAINYALIETWRHLRFLVEKYRLTRENLEIERAAEFVFTCQTNVGDIRGMLSNQYATYYTGAILALLNQAGYEKDSRVEKGIRWLLSMRQADGGWTIPILTHKLDRKTLYRVTSQHAETLEPDRSKPFSHNWTGMVLRAFATSSKHRRSSAALRAAELLKSRFFQKDSYSSYKDASYWVRFEFPFWWSNLVSALDSLSLMDFSQEDPDIKNALKWLRDHQQRDGLWNLNYAESASRETAKTRNMRLWVTLAICRILNRFG